MWIFYRFATRLEHYFSSWKYRLTSSVMKGFRFSWNQHTSAIEGPDANGDSYFAVIRWIWWHFYDFLFSWILNQLIFFSRQDTSNFSFSLGKYSVFYRNFTRVTIYLHISAHSLRISNFSLCFHAILKDFSPFILQINFCTIPLNCVLCWVTFFLTINRNDVKMKQNKQHCYRTTVHLRVFSFHDFISFY